MSLTANHLSAKPYKSWFQQDSVYHTEGIIGLPF